jgi:hypothetical protein
MVSFEPDSEDAGTALTTQKLRAKINEAFALTERMKKLDQKLQTNDVYVRKTMSEGPKKGGGNFQEVMVPKSSAEADLAAVMERSKFEQ